jgi:RNA polymerase sigma-70 factor (ECF subfamily)
MAPASTETDDVLLSRLRRGDEAAFVALYRRRQGAIYRFALHMSGSATAAEDITQEVFLALLRQE